MGGNVVKEVNSKDEDELDDFTVFLLLQELRIFDEKTLPAMYETQIIAGGWAFSSHYSDIVAETAGFVR